MTTHAEDAPRYAYAGLMAELRRREQQSREAAFAAEVLYFTGLACPFPAVVHYYPDLERLTVTAGGLGLASMSAEEARRSVNDSHAAAKLGLRARDAYLALEPLPHDHPLGQD